jgi:hypothetical protein
MAGDYSYVSTVGGAFHGMDGSQAAAGVEVLKL